MFALKIIGRNKKRQVWEPVLVKKKNLFEGLFDVVVD